VLTRIPSVDLNGVFAVAPDPPTAGIAASALVASKQISGSFPWSIQLPGVPSPAIRAVAESYGLKTTERRSIYVLRLDRLLPAVTLPADTVLRRVSASRADDFAAGLAMCWESTRYFFRRLATPEFLSLPGIAAWVAECNGEIIATAMGIAIDEWVTVMAVATRPDQRRRGLGGAVTAAVLQDSARCGTRWAALTPTAGGAPLYRGMGFTKVGAVTVFSPDVPRSLSATRLPGRGGGAPSLP